MSPCALRVTPRCAGWQDAAAELLRDLFGSNEMELPRDVAAASAGSSLDAESFLMQQDLFLSERLS